MPAPAQLPPALPRPHTPNSFCFYFIARREVFDLTSQYKDVNNRVEAGGAGAGAGLVRSSRAGAADH